MDSVRIDKWLWAARFFKTRSLAQSAVRGGHVAVNGHACKPARSVSVGDRLRIVRGEVEFEIVVEALADKRGPASFAQTLYQETPASIKKREEKAEQKRLTRHSAPEGRPDKRDRRKIRSFTGKR
ncbi:MAG: RNA-binding S4 domain-containing protein [Wenzhouxiangellaceae bacterium]